MKVNFSRNTYPGLSVVLGKEFRQSNKRILWIQESSSSRRHLPDAGVTGARKEACRTWSSRLITRSSRTSRPDRSPMSQPPLPPGPDPSRTRPRCDQGWSVSRRSTDT